MIIKKKDIFDDLVQAIVRLGKNEFADAAKHIQRADKRLAQWLVERPEKKATEQSQPDTDDSIGNRL